MQAQKMSPIWYWVSPIWSDLLRFGPIWSENVYVDLVIRVTVVKHFRFRSRVSAGVEQLCLLAKLWFGLRKMFTLFDNEIFTENCINFDCNCCINMAEREIINLPTANALHTARR